jgi:SAM-dependent methyltransferase
MDEPSSLTNPYPPLRCPNCAQPLTIDVQISCENGHSFEVHDGVLSLLSDEFATTLHTFLAGFEPLRQADGKRLTDPATYESLPFTPELQSDPEWRMRSYDAAVVGQLLSARRQQRILEIGAWNGWLSNRLAQAGHQLTAVDYFADAYDGLRARQFYRANWTAIQMDLTDLAVLDCLFEVVILNRCVQFYADPVAYARTALEKVAPGGLLILTGLAFFMDPGPKAAAVEAFHRMLDRHGLVNIKPMKGYLDGGDWKRLRQLSVSLHPYNQLWRANLKSRLIRSAPRYYYGLYYAR